MNSMEKKRFALARIAGVLWFFLCLFGAIAAVGVYFVLVSSSHAGLLLQLGFTGGAGALVMMGVVQGAQAFVMNAPLLQRLTKAAGVLLGGGGAVLALGIFFTILSYPNAQSFLQIGLLGTAAGLVVTGGLKLGEVNAMDTPSEDRGGV